MGSILLPIIPGTLPLLDVPPCLPNENATHGCFGDPESSCEGSLADASLRIKFTSLAHQIWGQFVREAKFFCCVFQVHLVGSNEKMVGIYARWIIALMADFHSIRNRRAMNLPRITMGKVISTSEVHQAVPGFSFSTNPLPATFSNLDSSPKIMGWFFSTSPRTVWVFPALYIDSIKLELRTAGETFNRHLKTFLSDVYEAAGSRWRLHLNPSTGF